jgi:hypothetical protein
VTLSGRGRIIVQRRGDHIDRAYVYVPVEVARDSQFPLKPGPVRVSFDPKTRRITVGGGP